MDLHKLLTDVCNQKTTVSVAQSLIEEHFASPIENDDPVEKIRTAFDRLKRTAHVEELLKLSSNFISQIAESMPASLEKLQENFTRNAFTFSPNKEGINAKLSVFRTYHAGEDCIVTNNSATGSQWFGINIANKSELKDNKFAGVQLSELNLVSSNLSGSTLNLCRISNATLDEARFENNRMKLATFSDFCLSESDFTSNLITKSQFVHTVINASRLANLELDHAEFKECEFDKCDIQGIVFSNCSFVDCNFQDIEAIAQIPITISGAHFSEKLFSKITCVEDFVSALNEK